MTRRRNKERIIPATQLSWVVADSGRDAWSLPELSKEAIAEAHYENRQSKRDYLPVVTSKDIKFVEEWPSCLQRVEPLTRGEYKEGTDPKLRDLSFSRMIPDRQHFTNKVDELISKSKLLTTNNWMRYAVLYPLGPENIEKVLDQELNLEGRRYKLLTYNNHSTTFLAVEPKRDPNRTKILIESALGDSSAHADSLLLSAPSGGYGIKFKYGEDPKYISSARESHFAVIFDDKFEEEKLQSPKEFYENLLRLPIRSNRLLNDPEKRWMEKQCERYDLRQRRIRLLEFNSTRDRNNAMERKLVEYLDVLFCDTMFSYNEPYEQVHLYINYEMVPKNLDCVAVTLVHESDKKFAESAFSSHGLTSHYYNDDNKQDMNLRYDYRLKTIVVQDFPRHMNSYDSREWFIKRIAEKNFISIEKIERYVEKLDDAMKFSRIAKRRNIIRDIEYELYKIGHIHRIYKPINEPWIEELQGAMGARFFLKVVKERADVPWLVTRKNKGPYKRNEHFTVHFDKVEKGVNFISHVLRESNILPIFKCDRIDRDGPKLTPCFRISFAISRSMRVAIDQEVRVLDTDLRKTFSTLSKNEDEMMKSHEASYYGARIYEEWTPGSETGIIGVQGWSPAGLRHFTARLRNILTPKKLDAKTLPELLFGIGELYAKNLEEKYDHEVIVDVDKYSQNVWVAGKYANEAFKDLENYPKKKNSITVSTVIPVFFPHLNGRIWEILTPRTVYAFRKSLGLEYLNVVYNKGVIEFKGTIEAYEMLMKALSAVSDEIFRLETRNRIERVIPNLTCQACWSETGSMNDSYHFHCGHTMCRPCLNMMVTTRTVNKQFKMCCDAEGCNEFLPPTEILNIIRGGGRRIRELDTSKLSVLVKHSKDEVINANVGMKSCGAVDCAGILSKSEGSIDDPKVCDVCSFQYCRECLENVHPGTTCAENARLMVPEASIAEYIQKTGPEFVKNCPNCSSLVEKKEGCNHMECSCKTHFCWVCLYIATGSGDCYRHMQEEHGGHGGNYGIPEFEDMDEEIQLALQEDFGNDRDAINQVLLEEYRAQELRNEHYRDPNLFPEEYDFLDEEEEDRLNNEFMRRHFAQFDGRIPLDQLFHHIRQEALEGARNLHRFPQEAPVIEAPPVVPDVPNVPELIRNLIPEEHPLPPIPTRSHYLVEFPLLLSDTFPIYYGDAQWREEILRWLNESETQEVLNVRIGRLHEMARGSLPRDQMYR